jgi:hypothetical protein
MASFARRSWWLIFLTLAAGKMHPAAPPGSVLPSCWVDLASDDARQGYAALCWLADHPRRAVPYLEVRLRPAVPYDPKRLARLIGELDGDEYAVRQRATKELEALGERAEPALRAALARKPPLEVHRRITRLLDRLDGPVTEPEVLRVVRAVEALERMGSAGARALLSELAKGQAGRRLTREAKESLERCRERSRPSR